MPMVLPSSSTERSRCHEDGFTGCPRALSVPSCALPGTPERRRRTSTSYFRSKISGAINQLQQLGAADFLREMIVHPLYGSRAQRGTKRWVSPEGNHRTSHCGRIPRRHDHACHAFAKDLRSWTDGGSDDRKSRSHRFG